MNFLTLFLLPDDESGQFNYCYMYQRHVAYRLYLFNVHDCCQRMLVPYSVVCLITLEHSILYLHYTVQYIMGIRLFSQIINSAILVKHLMGSNMYSV